VAAAVAREQALRAVSSAYDLETPIAKADIIVETHGVAFCVPSKYSEGIGVPWGVIRQVREVTVGGIMLDVGANIGQTCVPRVLLGDFQVIYAAEPEPRNYARLKTTIEANRVRGFVLPDRVAIGSRDGSLRFHQGHYRSHRAAADSEPDAVEVPCLTLDSWIERLGIDAEAISFVKVDTNGYEVDVLRGAERLLQKGLAAWQLEVAPAFMAPLKADVEILSTEIRRHFTHFIDLGREAASVPTTELPGALAYLRDQPTSKGGKPPQTDLLCFNS
jgi:FkbM family methyltransferase